MNRKFSYIGLAAAATLIGQQALAQSATVDASANVVAAEKPIGLSTLSNVSFGTVTIPSSTEVTCGYMLYTGYTDSTFSWSIADRNFRPQVGYSEEEVEVYDVVPDNTPNTSPLVFNPAGVETGCEFSSPPSFGEVDVECSLNAPFSISVSATPDAGAQYAGLEFYVPGQNAVANVTSCDGSKNLTVGGGLFVPGTATPYTGSVGTYTIEAIYD